LAASSAAAGEWGRPARGLSEVMSLRRGEPFIKSAGQGGSTEEPPFCFWVIRPNRKVLVIHIALPGALRVLLPLREKVSGGARRMRGRAAIAE